MLAVTLPPASTLAAESVRAEVVYAHSTVMVT